MDRKNVSSVKNIPPCLYKVPSFLTLIDSGCCTGYTFSSLIYCSPHLLTMFTEGLGCGSWSFYPCCDGLSSWAISVPSVHLQSRQALSLLISGDFSSSSILSYRPWLSTMIRIFYLWNFNRSCNLFILQMSIEYLPWANHCASHFESSYSWKWQRPFLCGAHKLVKETEKPTGNYDRMS